VWYPPFSFNKVVSEPGSVDQERPAMVKKKKKKERCRKKEKNMVSLDVCFKES
jgi:hypothetical protein